MSIQLLPEEAVNEHESQQVDRTSKTYQVNFQTGMMRGFIDGIQAMKQAIFGCLQTNWMAYDIYDAEYGLEMSGLLGQNEAYIQCEMKRRIIEALLMDNRIQRVEQFDFQAGLEKDAMIISFVVKTIFGDIAERLEMTIT